MDTISESASQSAAESAAQPTSKPTVALLDYGSGNVRSAHRAV